MKRKLISAFLILLLLSGCTAATKPSTEPTTAAKATTPAETASTIPTLPAATPETTEAIPAPIQTPTEQPTQPPSEPPQIQPAAEMPTDPPATQPTQAPTEPPTEAPRPTEATSWDTEEAVAQVCVDCNAYIVSIGCTADPAAASWAAPQYTHWEGGSAAWLRDQLIAGIDYYKSTGVTALYVTYEADPRGGFQVYLRYAI